MRLAIASFVAWEDVGNEIWLMDMRDGQAFALLGSAASAWSSVHLREPLSVHESDAVGPLIDAGILVVLKERLA